MVGKAHMLGEFPKCGVGCLIFYTLSLAPYFGNGLIFKALTYMLQTTKPNNLVCNLAKGCEWRVREWSSEIGLSLENDLVMKVFHLQLC
jgi:hypothetical protein